MPEFINTNSHLIYLDLPSRDEDLTKFAAFQKFKLTGKDADVAEQTNGVVNLAKADDDTLARIDRQLHDRGLAGIGETTGKDTSTGGTVTTGDLANTSGGGSGGEPPEPEKTAARKAVELPEPPPKVGKGSSRDEWAKFADKELGLEFDENTNRDELFKLVDAELAKRRKAAES